MYTGTVLCKAFLIEFRCEYSLFLETMNINASLKAPATLTTTNVVPTMKVPYGSERITRKIQLMALARYDTTNVFSTGTLVHVTNRGRNFYSPDWWYVCLFE